MNWHRKNTVIHITCHMYAQPSLRSGDDPMFLVLCPSRKPAQQVAAQFGKTSKSKSACVYGWASRGPEIRDLNSTMIEKNQIKSVNNLPSRSFIAQEIPILHLITIGTHKIKSNWFYSKDSLILWVISRIILMISFVTLHYKIYKRYLFSFFIWLDILRISDRVTGP